MVQFLALDRGKNRSAGSTRRLAVVRKLIGIADLVGPAIMAGVSEALLLDEGNCLIDPIDPRGLGQKTALFDLLGKCGIRGERSQASIPRDTGW